MVQEQHPERAALYRQWRGFDWPLYVDALNLLDHRAVPLVLGLDARGRVLARMRRPEELAAFLAAAQQATPPPADAAAGGDPDAAAVGDPGAAPALAPPVHPLPGDAHFHAGRLDEAVAAYRAAEPDDARARFRLGVALMRRAESGRGNADDAQRAVEAWGEALAADPAQYIWRRRLQQYGPTLAKPYNMYGWVEQARAELRERGAEPLPLATEPRGSEVLGRDDLPAEAGSDFDAAGELPRDTAPWVAMTTMVTPARVRPGSRVRVRVTLTPEAALWNNETEPLRLHATAPEGWSIPQGRFQHEVADGTPVESQETRVLEFEVEVPAAAAPGPQEVTGYVAYNVCEDAQGTCRLLRRDFRVRLVVDPEAPEIR